MRKIATFDFANRVVRRTEPGVWTEEMPLENKPFDLAEDDPFEGDDPSFWLDSDTDQTSPKR